MLLQSSGSNWRLTGHVQRVWMVALQTPLKCGRLRGLRDAEARKSASEYLGWKRKNSRSLPLPPNNNVYAKMMLARRRHQRA